MIDHKRILNICLLTVFGLGFNICTGQKSHTFTSENSTFYQAQELFDLGAFAEAERLFDLFIADRKVAEKDEYNLVYKQAELFKSLSSLYRDDLDAEHELLTFIQKNRPDPIADLASIQLGNYYFNEKNYRKALEYYAEINPNNLSTDQLSELKFKQGYAYFLRKDFDNSITAFSQIRENKNRFYYPSNYYYGLSHYYAENYEEAIASFSRVENSKSYESHIPYYKTNILSKESKWPEIIEYLQPRIQNKNLKNKKELNQLLGQAYFEQKKYAKALPHLEYYDEHSGKMRAEDFYQLGYTQYITKNYKAAQKTFLEITNLKNKLGQNANFYLADCYLKNGNKASARNAFAKTYKLDYDPIIKEEALYNYGLLSAELGDDRAAVNALTQLPNNSKYYIHAQETLGKVFLNSHDYQNALNILEQIPRNTTTLKESYQKITYYYALQSLNDKNPTKAKSLFKKSIAENQSQNITAASNYWLGYMDHKGNKYNESVTKMSKFISNGNISMPSTDVNLPMAFYIQGYNYFQLKNYSQAATNFEKAANGKLSRQVKNDLYLRWGDCLIKKNDYDKAFRTYAESQKHGQQGADYVLFQQGLIRGLTKRNTEKIVLLNQLTNEFKSSNLVDDALFEIGNTYIEQGRPIEAIGSFQKLIQNHKVNSNLINRSYLKLGLLSYNQGDVKSALKNYSTLLTNHPSRSESAEAISAIEEIYIDDLNDPQGYEKFLETFPAFKLGNAAKDSLNYRVAYSLYEDGTYDQAVESFGDYLKKFPAGIQRIDALFFRAESKTILKEYSSAFEDYKTLIEIGQNPRLEDAVYKAALISYNHNEDFDEAYRLYNRLNEVSSDDKIKFEAQVGALQSAYRISNEKAVLDYANLVITNPDATTDQKGSAYFYRAKVSQQREDYDLALESYNHCTKLLDNILAAESRYQISAIYYKKSELDLTETYSEQAIHKNSSYPYWVAKNLILLSDVLRDKGDLFNARAALEAVIENYDKDPGIRSEAKSKLTLIESLENQSNRIDTSAASETLQLQDHE